mgnify:CR=1 FL=1
MVGHEPRSNGAASSGSSDSEFQRKLWSFTTKRSTVTVGRLTHAANVSAVIRFPHVRCYYRWHVVICVFARNLFLTQELQENLPRNTAGRILALLECSLDLGVPVFPDYVGEKNANLERS